MISLWETLNPYKSGSMKFTILYNGFKRYKILLGVPEAPNPPKFGRVSPFLFSNIHKPASKPIQNMPKNTLRVSWDVSMKTQKNSKLIL
jgi:hypothetical protein